jgi:hypothetical protein
MANNPLLDIQVRKRESTNVPLPFEAMYTILAERQKRYDDIEAIERQQKNLISTFTSPISGHNAYLEKKKTEFLDQAMQLHNSMPDKANAEYQRKLNQLVDGWNMDPNIATIRESSENWKQKIEAQKQLMLNDQYSPIMDVDANFQGVNPDGTLAKYNFYGMKPKPDYVKAMLTAKEATPSKNKTVSYYKGNMMYTNVYKGKTPEDLEANLYAYLSPDHVKQIMFEKNLPTPADYEKWVKAQSIDMSDYDVSTEVKPETSLAQLSIAQQNLQLAKDNAAWNKEMDMKNYELNKFKTISDAMKGGAGAGGANGGQSMKPGVLTLPNVGHSEDVKDQITPAGEINSTGGLLLWGDSKQKTLEANPTISKVKINADKVNSLLGKNKTVIRDFKKDLMKLREGALTNVDKYSFTSSKEAQEALELITTQANTSDAKVWEIGTDNSAKLKTADEWAKIWTGIQDTKSDQFAKMAGPLNSYNPYGAEAYDLNIGGKRYIVAVKPSADLQGAIKTQNHELSKAFNAGYAEFPNGYIRYKIGSNGQLTTDIIKTPVNVYFADPNNIGDRIIESQDPKNYFVIREKGN